MTTDTKRCLPDVYYKDDQYKEYVEVCEFFHNIADKYLEKNSFINKENLRLSVDYDGDENNIFNVIYVNEKNISANFIVELNEENKICNIQSSEYGDYFICIDQKQLSQYILYYLLEIY